MATTEITIIYSGVVGDIERKGATIPAVLVPAGSYVDLPVMTEGFSNADGVGDGETYGRSAYATNIPGVAGMAGVEPIGSAPVPFAYFEMAVQAAAKAESDGTANGGVTFDVEGDKDVLYWKQMGRNMADRFYTKVGDEEYGVAPALTPQP